MSLFTDWKFNWKDDRFIHHGDGVCLDLGCGDGNLRSFVEDAGWTYLTCDIDATRGEIMIQCDGMFLPFKDDCFDIILIYQVLEHMKDPLKLLKEVNRVLVRGGKIYGSVSCLEPFHDKCMYFGFTHRGIESILGDAGFINTELKVGINAFSLILRGLLMRLLPKKLGELVAFFVAKACIVSSVYAILLCRAIFSLTKRGRLSEDYETACEYIKKTAPMHFAGHIQFVTTAKK